MPVHMLLGSDPLSVRAKALVYEDARSRALLERIQQVAPSDATVLLYGETGTGKEIVARHVHALSRRAERAFVAVNCGALSATLVESELFGHERGAFTGASSAKAGWFEEADGGTLFLDEIGDLPIAMQVKLLRILQEGEVVRLGSRTPLPVNVRLIAASNVRLEEAVLAGRFREDLYYRLNVASLALAPLRERKADIRPLAEHFLRLYGNRLGIAHTSLTPTAAAELLEHPWPGNIRELENVIHHALLVCQDGSVDVPDLRLTRLQAHAPRVADPAAEGGTMVGAEAALERALIALFQQGAPNLYEQLEERCMRAAYRHCHKNQVQTARLLGISRNIVRARLIQYGELSGTPRTGSSRVSAHPPPPEPLAPEPIPAYREPSLHARGETLRIGFQRYGLLPLLKATGALERALAPRGIRVEWREFPSGIALVDALQSEALGLGLVGEGPSVFAQAAHVPIVYLAAEAPAPEREAIIVHARSSIQRVEQLRGRTVLLSRGSNTHYFLILALEEAKLDYQDIRLVDASPERALAMFESGLVDAWATWDPFLGSAQRAAPVRTLRDARGLTGNTSYYIATRAFAEQRRDLVQQFLHEINATARWASQNGPAALELLASQGSPQLDATTLGGGIGAWPIDAGHLASQQAVADAFLRLNLIARPVEVADASWRVPSLNPPTSLIYA